MDYSGRNDPVNSIRINLKKIEFDGLFRPE